MAEAHNKQSCPTCGRSTNVRKEKLNKELIQALFRVAKWAKEKNIDKPVKRADFSYHIMGLESNTANFAKLAWFAPEFFRNTDDLGNKASSYYHFNFDVIDEFFARHRKIATVCEVDPLWQINKVPHHQRTDERFINQIPALKEFLSEDLEYIVEYLITKNPKKYKEVELQQELPLEKI